MNSVNGWQQMLPMDAKMFVFSSEKVFVDVREAEEYEAGHIPNSKHIPLSQFSERVGELDQAQEYIMVCRSGNRSAKACDYLIALGYPKVHNLFGGMMNWVGDVKQD